MKQAVNVRKRSLFWDGPLKAKDYKSKIIKSRLIG